jgi:hypothetical protein
LEGIDSLTNFKRNTPAFPATRACSLTGPYGTGKSAFALLAAQTLGGVQWVRDEAREFLWSADPDLAERLFGTGGLAKKGARVARCWWPATGSEESRRDTIWA